MYEIITAKGFEIKKSNLNTQEEIMNANYIIECCLAVQGELRPCIKQSVYAVLVTAEGKEHFGANWMTNGEVSVCPRVTNNCPSGKGYELCKEICNQDWHAERSAINMCVDSFDKTEGSTVYLTGHTYCCDDCLAAMKTAGVKRAVVVDSGTVYEF